MHASSTGTRPELTPSSALRICLLFASALLLYPMSTLGEPPKLTLDGFLKPSINYSSDALNTFGGQGMGAPTSANAQQQASARLSRTSFQIGQSRVGLTVEQDPQVSGKIEFDFIDFAEVSPTVQANPRVRVAKVMWKPDEDSVLQLGQDWDLFSPLSPYTYNFVGGNYTAGNSGFMRHQLLFLRKTTSAEWGAALGMPGSNPLAAETNLEIGKVPTVAFRGSFSLGEKSRLGFSGIGTRIIFDETFEHDRNAYGTGPYFDAAWGRLSVRGEGYIGQNLANLGSLTLSLGRSDASMRDWGGYLSSRYTLNERSGIFGGASFAEVRNKGSVLAVTDPGTGILKNGTVRLGYDQLVDKSLKSFIEASRFHTKINQGSKTRWYRATHVEAGFLLTL